MHEINTEINPIDIINLPEIPEEQVHDFVPKKFDQFVGQSELKQKLNIYTTAAKMRGEPVDHILFSGPPGLGKTTLSQIMAHEMNVTIKICSGPMLERTGDLVAILSGLQSRDILFIDEIHRTPKAVEEVLYSAMEQFRVDVIVGQGVGAKTISVPLAPFTLIGATTKSGLLTAPLRSRFGITERLDFYHDTELQEIVLQYAQYLVFAITPDGALRIAHASRGTPRMAKKLTRRVRDFAQVQQKSTCDELFVTQALQKLGIDHEGLCSVDNLILKKILASFGGGPVGIETIAAIISEDSDTIETVYEPFLLRKGYLEKTSRGRQIPSLMQGKLRKKFFGQETVF
jgi:Holliday junction DNA helicase RuvB